MNMKTLLDVELEDRAVELAKLKLGSKEYIDGVDGFSKVFDRRIELEKLEMSEKQNEKQMKEERIARWVKILVDASIASAGLYLTYWGAKASWQFEEAGTITSQTGKKFMDRLFRK
jgi:hypothetical protein